MRHALIMAGGSGTRLWPLSRRARPKQLLRLWGGQSLLALSYRRVAALFEPANIWVITAAAQRAAVMAELPSLRRENLIGEPVGRDTANAIGLAAHIIAAHDPQATLAVFTADHIIRPQDAFERSVRAALAAAEQHADQLVTLGVRPDRPHTGYGYIQRGEAVGGAAFRVRSFREKPTRDVAVGYLRSGEFWWNSGMFVFRLPAILGALARHLPENAAALNRLAGQIVAAPEATCDTAAFGALRRISLDYGVLEKEPNVLMVGLEAEWRDVGSWAALAETLEGDPAGNTRCAERSLLLDSHNCTLVSDSTHLLVALGVDDLVVVHSADATLVCRREHAERVKELADELRGGFGETYA